MVVQGITLDALGAGAGHYPMTPLPGQAGNVAIAGHRTMYGKPFNELDRLAAGDRVTLQTPLATFVYQVVGGFEGHSNPWVVSNTDWSPISQTATSVLTLTTCHPKGSAKQRLVVRAALIDTENGI
ncbi:MAG: class E sortase [Actinomycetota bacterium]